MASLPVRDDVLMPLMEALVQIGAAAKQRRQAVSGCQRLLCNTAGAGLVHAACSCRWAVP